MVFLIFGIIYLTFFYLVGIFVGFYKPLNTLGLSAIYKYIIPIIVIVISSEKLRVIFLSQKKAKLSIVFTTISMIFVDLLVYADLSSINSSETLATIVGFSLFTSISSNLLYNYTTVRYGSHGIIIYRLLTVLYPYVFPIIPDVYIFFRVVFRIIYPYAMYLILDYAFKKRSIAMEYMDSKKRVINLSVAIVVIVMLVMLISCKFRYGVIVIGSGSMTGSLNVGDVVLLEKYNNQKIDSGDIIVFSHDDVKFVHRVVKITLTNGEYRYYTKGDANQDIDDGYVTKKDMVGVVRMRIRYLGYPSILLRDMFSNR